MNNKELFYFTGSCLALDDHPQFKDEIIQKINSCSIDWEKFVYQCSSHLILPTIYLKFQSQEILDRLPDELAGFLKEVYDLNLFRNQQIIEQLQAITLLLNEYKIYPIFLKGTAHLLDGLYSDAGERIIADIDLLVSEIDFMRAVRIMKNAGYESDNPDYLDMENIRHYPIMIKQGAAAPVEIHRIPVSEDYKQWFNATIIDKEKKAIPTLKGCFVLSDKHKTIHNFIHCQLGHKGHSYGIVSFRDLYDLYLLSKRTKIERTLVDIQSKTKAIAYFIFAAKALGLKERLYPANNLSFRVFLIKHELNMRSRIFYRIHRSAVYFGHEIFDRLRWILKKNLYHQLRYKKRPS